MATFTIRTVANNDEAYERSDDTFFAISNDGGGGAPRMCFGRSGGGQYWYSGWRFNNITIPQGTIISSAKITFTPFATNTIAATTVPIYANDVDNASDFAGSADVFNRVVTTANASWTPATTFTANTPVDTVDFTSVIQEIVDRGSWVSGNAMMIILKESAGTNGQDQRVYLFSDDSAKAPLLTINYAGGGFTPKIIIF